MVIPMTWVVVAFGAAITLLGILGVVRPASLLRLVERAWQSQTGLYFAIGIRVVLGIALLIAASQSRFPETFRIMGIISLVAAAVAPWFGLARLQRFVHWWTELPSGLVRVWSSMAAAFGAFLSYAAM